MCERKARLIPIPVSRTRIAIRWFSGCDTDFDFAGFSVFDGIAYQVVQDAVQRTRVEQGQQPFMGALEKELQVFLRGERRKEFALLVRSVYDIQRCEQQLVAVRL